jgi:hypothetical protein
LQLRVGRNVDGNVDGGDGRNRTWKKRSNYGLFEEREKGFEPSTLALAIHPGEKPQSTGTDRKRPFSSDSGALIDADTAPAEVDRPPSTAIGHSPTDRLTDKPKGQQVLMPLTRGFYMLAQALDTTPQRVAEMLERGELTLRK